MPNTVALNSCVSLFLEALIVVSLVASVDASAAAQAPHNRSRGELINPFLSPELGDWVVGPISWLLSRDEIDAYLRLASDTAARQFIEEFWLEHSEIREIFDSRATEADKRFGEGLVTGRHTDRGTIFVLYGEPQEVEYEEFRDVLDPDVEVWRYDRKAPPGLDGRKPSRRYRFAKEGDLTTFFRDTARRDTQRKLERSRDPRLPRDG